MIKKTLKYTGVLIWVFILAFYNIPLENIFQDAQQYLAERNVVDKLYQAKKISNVVDNFKPRKAEAGYQYTPTGGQLPLGTNAAITSGGTSGNVGSWKGTLVQDTTSPGYNWTINNSATGLNQQIQVDGVELNNANKFEIVMRANASVTTISRLYQVCDWISTTSVDNAADSQCTGGGWRTLNLRKVAITGTTITNYTWHVYDGYWTTSATGNTSVSTPLSNFINSSNRRVLLRAYSTSTAAGTHIIDWVRLDSVIDPVYFPAGFTQVTGGSVTTSYINTTNGTLTGQSGSDNQYLQVPGASGVVSDFYLSFKDVRTYTGMNTIVMVAEYSCSATGISHRPKIWNFTTSGWEDLTTSSIACSATDATNQFAKNNITISDYVSTSKEVRIGWRGLSGSTVSIRLDHIRILAGTTNTDSTSAGCEISFGTTGTGTCDDARNLDSTLASPSLWSPSTELESTAMSHDYYGLNNDGDATTNEAAVSMNVNFSLTLPANASVAAMAYAARWRSASSGTTLTTRPQLRDYSGANPTASGGWTDVGTTATSTYVYADSIVYAYLGSNADDYLDTVNNRTNMRFRTSASTSTTNITTTAFDFMFMSVRWIESGGTTQALTIGATNGSKATNLNSGDASQYINSTSCIGSSDCAAFTLSLSAGSETITSIKLTETGSADASGALSNVALFYDTDGNYSNGVTGQFGSTVANFTTETATVSGSLAVSSGTTYYFYVQFNLANAGFYPKGGHTIDFQIAANADVGIFGSSTKTGAPASLAGTTTVKPNATSVTYGTGLSDGGRSSESITISGYGFGAPGAGAERENCAGGADTGCARFIIGGNATVSNADTTSWSNTSIVFTINASLASLGGDASLEVVAASQNDSSPLTFYIYPNITGMTTCAGNGDRDNPCGANAAMEYSSTDNYGLVQLNGDHFSVTAGTVEFTGAFGAITGVVHASAEGACSTGNWSAASVCLQVSNAIDNAINEGTITLTRNGDSKTDTIDLRVLPRIGDNTPSSGSVGDIIVINGNHFCQTETCPDTPPTSEYKVFFGAVAVASSDFVVGGSCPTRSWSDTKICVKVPSGALTGIRKTKVVGQDSSGHESQRMDFEVLSSGFPASGSLTSTVFDTGITTGVAYNSIMWKGTRGGLTDKVRFQFATSANENGPWNFRGGAGCGAVEWYDATEPNVPVKIQCAPNYHTGNNRYFKYKIQLCSLNDCAEQGTVSPQVNEVIINWSP